MRDMFFDEKDESEWEKKSEFATFYQDVKERYRKSGRYIAKMKFITGEDQVDAFTEKYMEMQAEYWIALLYLAYRKNAMDQDELVKIMKYDAHDAEQFFEKFEELARTSSVQKKVQNLSVNQENGMWRLDFSVLKTEFINFNIGMIIEKKEDVEAAFAARQMAQTAANHPTGTNSPQAASTASGISSNRTSQTAMTASSAGSPADGKIDWKAQKEEQARLRKRQNELKKIEDKIHELETRDGEIDELLSQEDVYTDVSRLMELNKEKESIQKELEVLYEKWEELAE